MYLLTGLVVAALASLWGCASTASTASTPPASCVGQRCDEGEGNSQCRSTDPCVTRLGDNTCGRIPGCCTGDLDCPNGHCRTTADARVGRCGPGCAHGGHACPSGHRCSAQGLCEPDTACGPGAACPGRRDEKRATRDFEHQLVSSKGHARQGVVEEKSDRAPQEADDEAEEEIEADEDAGPVRTKEEGIDRASTEGGPASGPLRCGSKVGFARGSGQTRCRPGYRCVSGRCERSATEVEKNSVLYSLLGASSSDGVSVSDSASGVALGGLDSALGGVKGASKGGKGGEKSVKLKVGARLGGAVGVGTIDKAKVKSVFRRRRGAIKHCYERALKSNPNLKGKVTIRFSIGSVGRVTSATVKATSGV
ncbi:MAG: AgmX/PglI C-terminal domain-containing protein, partial [Myxococcota bacterium]|nr:AgmX/PglI C-terminal domain-containing protein [Myxococcota bacterium]